MQDVSVRVEGASQLRRALRRAGRDLADLKEANSKVARLVASEAAVRAPRRTGKLAASIRGNRAAGKAVVSAGKAQVPYAAPIHWGWPSRHIRPNPWISKTAQQTQPIWLRGYEQEIQQIVDSI